ncbi:MAG: DNA ligase D [Negativicutes bacterium]|nr:DNA ligase D [Negativicutes bacterium]
MRKDNDPLLAYKQKRDFSLTPEPATTGAKETEGLSFVVQMHAARSLHYDFRLELDGTLKSWAVPKGPSFDPAQKRLAIHVEDHPLDYAGFEGVIPSGQYGAGSVIVWDRGRWEPIGDPRAGLDAGQLKFRLLGEKLQGAWVLVRLRAKPGDRQEAWLLIKERDAVARPESEFKVVEALPDSVMTNPAGPEALAGARRSPLPPALAPQLATLVDRAPAGGDWAYEIKFDGYRILARVDHGKVNLFSRGGQDWTTRLPGVAAALEDLNPDSAWLDGEIVVSGAAGVPDFGALQNSLEAGRTGEIQYFVFDIPFYGGFDLRDVPLVDRRALLAKLLPASADNPVRFSEDFAADGGDILDAACRLGLEGVIGKRRDARYVSGRSSSWIKLKCSQSQEFVVAGYTVSAGRGGGIGALLLGVYDDAGRLRYAGRVGTGFDNRTALALRERLTRLAAAETPLFEAPKDARGNWVAPELVAEVSFAEWTKEGRLRQAVFHGLRTDKAAASVVRETAQGESRSDADKPGSQRRPTPAARAESSSPPISNPARIVDPSTGLSKLDLVTYYQLAAERLLPHLANRPVAFVRAPTGLGGELFFQKHGETLRIPGLRQLDPGLDPGHPALLAIDSREALIGAAQMNVVEFHTWNATAKYIARPDRMVFDLDPGEGLAWPKMLEAAELVRALLEELGLQSFLKTSGGKGLHVVVPLTPRDDWETVKDFSKAVVQHLATVIPSLFVAQSGSGHRLGKVFADYLRNGRGATTAVAFSARARPGLGVSMPCSWQELPLLTGGAHWTVANAGERLESGEDPWGDYVKTKQILRAASKKMLRKG